MSAELSSARSNAAGAGADGPATSARTIVVKVGTSSLTDRETSGLDQSAFDKLCLELTGLLQAGHRVALVSSAAISAGMGRLGLAERPRDFGALQALSAVGQTELMSRYGETLAAHDTVCGQVLLAPPDFFDRSRYLRARSCIEQQWALGVLPIINENDAVADDAIRFGDNDRIAALVAHLVQADLLVLLTDTAGLLTADPRVDANASLIEEVHTVDRELKELAGGSSSSMSQGGMASKLAAASIASWSGVEALIAATHRPNVLADAVAGVAGVGTRVKARTQGLSARKLWIAFGVASTGALQVDEGAKQALLSQGSSLLAVGLTGVSGSFAVGDAVDIVGADGAVFAKGLVSADVSSLAASIGQRSVEAVHRDSLVVLPD